MRLIQLLSILILLSDLGGFYGVTADSTPPQESTLSSDGEFITSLQSTTNKKRYLILAIGRLGLANRLRSIADWYHIAALSDRTLLVVWLATSDCNILFTDLFESVPERMKIIPLQLPLDPTEATRFLADVARAENVTSLVLDENEMWAEGRQSFILDRKQVMSVTEVNLGIHAPCFVFSE